MAMHIKMKVSPQNETLWDVLMYVSLIQTHHVPKQNLRHFSPIRWARGSSAHTIQDLMLCVANATMLASIDE